MRELKAEQEGIVEFDKVKSKGGVKAPTAPKTLSTPEVKLGGRRKGVGVGRQINENTGGDDDFMLLTEEERKQRVLDEQIRLNAQGEGFAPVPNRLIPTTIDGEFDFENPRGGPARSDIPKTERELHEIGRQETLNKFSEVGDNFKNTFGVVSTKQEDDARRAAVQARIKKRTKATKDRVNSFFNNVKTSKSSKSIVDTVRGN